LMPAFERNLQKLMEEAHAGKKKKKHLENLWAKVICSRKEERVFFRFASTMLSQEREFKLKAYPMLGMAFVFPFIFLFNSLAVGQSFQDVAEGSSYYGIYFTAVILGTSVHALGSSENYKGSWVFRATPVSEYKLIYRAALKAFFVKLYVPVFFLLSVIFLGIFSVRILPDLLIVLVSVLLCTVIAYRMLAKNAYPFSEPFESMQEGGSTASYFLFMIVVGLFAGAHAIVSVIPGNIALYIYFAILCVVTYFSWRAAFHERPPLELDPPHGA